MKVLKFGGTSVGTVESLQNVKKIIESISGEAVIVVSALGGLTDHLISTARKAEVGNETWKEEMQAIALRHFDIICNVVDKDLKEETRNKVSNLLSLLEKTFDAVYQNRQLTDNKLDEVVSFGERMSSHIVADMVADGKRYYSPDFIKTEKRYGKNVADIKATEKLIAETLKLSDNEKAIIPGFISSDVENGRITNLGRGGSDYTGALLAATLGADVLEIWTDVDGFMTADPRVVKEALIIPHLSFTESMELCNFGAKVIYPPTIYPVFHKNIPIKILNTFNPSYPGTLVTDHNLKESNDVKGVTSLKDISLLSFKMENDQNFRELSKRAYNALARKGVRIIPVDNSHPEKNFLIAVPSGEASLSVVLLNEEFTLELTEKKMKRPEIISNMAALAVVGKKMKTKERLAARIGHSLLRNGITVEAFSSESDTTLIYVIDSDKAGEAVKVAHSLIF